MYWVMLQDESPRRARAELMMWLEKRTGNDSAPIIFQEALTVCDPAVFPTIRRMLVIAVCQPMTTSTAERSFSALRRVKTWLHSRIGQKRLKAAVHWVRVSPFSAESSPNLAWAVMGLCADSARRLSVRAEP